MGHVQSEGGVDEGCAQPGEHRGHLCRLLLTGPAEEVVLRTVQPESYCRTCGIRVNRRGNVCRPQRLP